MVRRLTPPSLIASDMVGWGTLTAPRRKPHPRRHIDYHCRIWRIADPAHIPDQVGPWNLAINSWRVAALTTPSWKFHSIGLCTGLPGAGRYGKPRAFCRRSVPRFQQRATWAIYRGGAAEACRKPSGAPRGDNAAVGPSWDASYQGQMWKRPWLVEWWDAPDCQFDYSVLACLFGLGQRVLLPCAVRSRGEGVGATSRWICVCGRSGVALLGSHSHRAGRRQLREAGSSHLTSVLHLRLRLVPHSPSSSASHGYRPADRGAMRLALLTRWGCWFWRFRRHSSPPDAAVG